MIPPDYYARLGLIPSVSKAEIKKAYRKLALELHPDKNKHPRAQEMFIEIHEAFRILYDDLARERYDREYSKYKSQFIKDEEGDGFTFSDESLHHQSKQARKEGKEYATMAFESFYKTLSLFFKETSFHLGNTVATFVGIMLMVSGCGNILAAVATGGDVGNPAIGIILFPAGLLLYRFAGRRWSRDRS